MVAPGDYKVSQWPTWDLRKQSFIVISICVCLHMYLLLCLCVSGHLCHPASANFHVQDVQCLSVCVCRSALLVSECVKGRVRELERVSVCVCVRD